ncbi:xanthine dehydrogenase family protein molybdopterin-binding subunit [Tissierella sp. Yu-01]|uniref:xanthine dehydrogenase family protein molybdopterin-binding subunit n=1 Tax=Tissierella sp. Yu-01 TaxID=3035694 RepID=UPI00240CE916|nr:xanthine dehydrogenase family protein molybdopterin-binding subunit [Tissierella sp. Yu-01]WFA10438.1 xanthine dehydrogenase family protein molybdopterin-binding subunit [Tissierella sp. Yu-01]
MPQHIGVNTLRKDAWEKVTGRAKYNGDNISPDILHARLLTSPYAHALIKNIDTRKAMKSSGVKAIITGKDSPFLTGPMICDRPIIARGKVRYFGEPVAVVVANSEEEAMRAVHLIEVEYEKLPVVNSIRDAIIPESTLVHKDLNLYYYPASHIYPEFDSNIMDHVKIRKGDIERGLNESEVVVEASFSLPQSDHIAMETRNAMAQIQPDGTVIIYTSSQAPFAVKEELSKTFNIPEGKIIVRTPYVGGAFGGKATIQLEYIVYLASLAVDGRLVRLANSREQDMMSSPSKIAAEAKLKIGATKVGKITALECTYMINCGAYADTGPRMAKSIAASCSGPYNIENIHCDSYSVYTNHCYVTSYRGFGHTTSIFCIERIIELLAEKLELDPFEVRLINAIKESNYTPTQDKVTLNNTGDMSSCLVKLRDAMNWDEGIVRITEDGKIRAKGISGLWKTSNSPTNATSGAILTLNSDGSINLNFGGVEIGPGMKTTVAMILAEKLKMSADKIHVFMGVDTQVTPKHWKTVASMTTFMAGNAVIKAADDLIKQLQQLGSIVLKCQPEDLEVANERVYYKSNPDLYIDFKNIVHGYKYDGGQSIWGQMIASGSYIFSQLKPLEKETGKGKTGVSWTVGAQGVEIEYDPRMHTYRLIKAYTVIDGGSVINPKLARGLIMGGMSMGLGLATREDFLYDSDGIIENTSLRTYKVMRYGENPDYYVEFIETPQIDGPFGTRGIGEHGILGIPSAFANAISAATKVNFNSIPITSETIWKKLGEKNDTI